MFRIAFPKEFLVIMFEFAKSSILSSDVPVAPKAYPTPFRPIPSALWASTLFLVFPIGRLPNRGY